MRMYSVHMVLLFMRASTTPAAFPAAVGATLSHPGTTSSAMLPSQGSRWWHYYQEEVPSHLVYVAKHSMVRMSDDIEGWIVPGSVKITAPPSEDPAKTLELAHLREEYTQWIESEQTVHSAHWHAEHPEGIPHPPPILPPAPADWHESLPMHLQAVAEMSKVTMRADSDNWIQPGSVVVEPLMSDSPGDAKNNQALRMELLHWLETEMTKGFGVRNARARGYDIYRGRSRPNISGSSTLPPKKANAVHWSYVPVSKAEPSYFDSLDRLSDNSYSLDSLIEAIDPPTNRIWWHSMLNDLPEHLIKVSQHTIVRQNSDPEGWIIPGTIRVIAPPPEDASLNEKYAPLRIEYAQWLEDEQTVFSPRWHAEHPEGAPYLPPYFPAASPHWMDDLPEHLKAVASSSVTHFSSDRSNWIKPGSFKAMPSGHESPEIIENMRALRSELEQWVEKEMTKGYRTGEAQNRQKSPLPDSAELQKFSAVHAPLPPTELRIRSQFQMLIDRVDILLLRLTRTDACVIVLVIVAVTAILGRHCNLVRALFTFFYLRYRRFRSVQLYNTSTKSDIRVVEEALLGEKA